MSNFHCNLLIFLSFRAKHSTCGIEFIYDFRAPRDVMDMLGSFGIVVHGLPTPQDVLSVSEDHTAQVLGCGNTEHKT